MSGTGVTRFPGLVKELVLTGDEGLDSVRQCSEMPIPPGGGSSYANKFKTRAMWAYTNGGSMETRDAVRGWGAGGTEISLSAQEMPRTAVAVKLIYIQPR